MGTIDILMWLLVALETLAVVVGFAHWSKVKNSYWKWFPFYLLFIVLSEITGFTFTLLKMNKANHDFFNYFVIPVEFLFFFWLFYRSFTNIRSRQLSIICMIIYACSIVIDFLFIPKTDSLFLASSYTIGNLLLLILVFIFFFRLISTDAILHFRQNMLFWVSGGLLLFYLGSFPFFSLRNIVGINYKELYYSYSYVMYTLNILMYLMFTFSFIWAKPNTEYSSS